MKRSQKYEKTHTLKLQHYNQRNLIARESIENKRYAINLIAYYTIRLHLMYRRAYSAYRRRSIEGIFLPFQRQNCT